MNNEKMNGSELTEKELAQVSGGKTLPSSCANINSPYDCKKNNKGQMTCCNGCPKNN